ncbi:uncharacterized protein LOC125657004 [Ostrea edulis]|uniref:uncharacterized protein LOC125657004 n=1 Tax=Ostrea edulis TaxID=37623 RepID=UPI0024AF1DBF|nr:uncharacterized protein LOC125657004 [Ostrea edulis]
MTGLVEVCTTSRYILSRRCAEFNTGYKTIRDSYSTNCTGFDPPCPLYYNSTETYKYSDCYRMFEIETNTIGTAKKTFEINEVDSTLTTKIVLTISPAIVMITILILIACFKVVYRVPQEKSNIANDDTGVPKENSNMSNAGTGMSKEKSNNACYLDAVC